MHSLQISDLNLTMTQPEL